MASMVDKSRMMLKVCDGKFTVWVLGMRLKADEGMM